MTLDELIQSKDAASTMGAIAETFTLRYEKKRLPEDMHPAIIHYADKDIAMGYDILSFDTPESVKPDRYIEVKTYRGHKHFYWSEGEIMVARLLSDRYYLYLIDFEKINNPNYQPEIIRNPARLFDFKTQWTSQPTKYVFSELSPENIPTDWFDSVILIGCYNTPFHLQWILNNKLYNVRASTKNSKHGEIDINDPRTKKARYLILYQTGALQNFMLFELSPTPRLAYNNEIRNLGYPTPHAPQYILHPILQRLPDFYVNLQQLFREALPKIENAIVGQPLYLTGRQLTNFMPQRPDNTRPKSIDRQQILMLEKRGALWTDQENNQLIAHMKAGLTVSDISFQMYRTEGSIRSRMKLLFESKRIPHDLYIKYIPTTQLQKETTWTEEMDTYIAEAFNNRVSISNMSLHLHIPIPEIWSRLKTLGIVIQKR